MESNTKRFIGSTRAKNKLNKVQRREKVLLNKVEELEKQLSFINSSKVSSDLKPFKIKADKRLTNEATPILLLSDFHSEEKVTKASTNGLNEFNPDICEARLRNWTARSLKIIESLRRDININNLVIGCLGDNITGYIHEELIESNYMSPLEAALFFQRIFIQSLKSIAEKGNFKTIKIVCKVGNHGRTSRRKKYSTGYKNNYEYLMYHNIKNSFEELSNYKNLEFIIEDNAFTYVQIYDKLIRFSHGDHFNYRGGIGGVEIPLKTWLYKMNSSVSADLSCMGHWHRHTVGEDFLINGTGKGFDAFATEHAFKYQPPTQQLQILDRKRGFSTNYKIYLD